MENEIGAQNLILINTPQPSFLLGRRGASMGKCTDGNIVNNSKIMYIQVHVQWNLVIHVGLDDNKEPSYNKVILLFPALYISVFLP